MIKYALFNPKSNEFKFISDSKQERENKILNTFSNKKALKPKGTEYTLDNFLANFERVKIQITKE